jgi:hypothetical protein
VREADFAAILLRAQEIKADVVEVGLATLELLAGQAIEIMSTISAVAV